MKLTMSVGNNKIGQVPNISLPPGGSCVEGVPCYTDGCYAMKAYRMYPNVRKSWYGNMVLWQEDPQDFKKQLIDTLGGLHTDKFRWHVGGDIPDQAYLDMMIEVANHFSFAVSFLVFTKRYEFDYAQVPNNLHVVLSAWPGLDLPDKKLPIAWLASDLRRPLDSCHIHCPGHCGDCDYTCWGGLAAGMDVVFDKH